jgi:putative DNA methylase
MLDWTSHERQLLLGAESRARFEAARQEPALFEDNEQLRGALLDFIADFADWDNSIVREYLNTSRALTQAAHEALGGVPGSRPLIVDPFAGGGSIPLEALRVGADAFASDLNPVAALLNKVVLEHIPKFGQRLADKVGRWGDWIKREAEKELYEFYPKDQHGATPIAYLWARTIQCEGPTCGAEVPLIRSLWLAKTVSRSVALQLVPNTKAKRVDFRIIAKQRDGWVDQANPERKIKDPKFDGTVKRGSATCPCCGYTVPVERVREQLKGRHGGADDARLFCVVATQPNEDGRHYRLPSDSDLKTVRAAAVELERRKSAHKGLLPMVPNEPTPQGGGKGAGRAFSQRNYGMDHFSDLFTSRQLLALTTLARSIQLAGKMLEAEEASGLALAVQDCLGLVFGRVADLANSLCGWTLDTQCTKHLFARQAIPIVWNFAEGVCIGESAGSWGVVVRRFHDVVASVPPDLCAGQSQQASAANYPLPSEIAHAFITDPPYYDAVPYADLSDFFYVWLRRTLPHFATDFGDELTPKDEECIVDDAKGKDGVFFERQMSACMAEGRRVLAPSGIAVVVFAHKSTAGWESLLQAMIDAGWVITGSWSIDTEMSSRLRARDSAALASSVHLVCRPRESMETDEIGDWRDVLQELPRRIHDWMPRLAHEGIVGADAIFACLGPALEIYSRFSRVEKASGETVTLKEYLECVWAAVAKEALTIIFPDADTFSFEEDARLTAMWLWTLSAGKNGGANSESSEDEDTEDEVEHNAKNAKSTGFVLEYDAARKIAQGLGAHLQDLGSLVEVSGKTARLLPVGERARHLFDKDERNVAPTKKKKIQQLDLFQILEKAEGAETTFRGATVERHDKTVLDRVHQSMILFAAGRGEALSRFLVEDGAGEDQRFWHLAQALSALYPKNCDEKRWVDGVLARKKGLGL